MAAAGEYWRTMQFSRTLAEGRNSSRRASFRFSNAPINGGSSGQHNAAAAERRPVRERRTPVEGEERRRGSLFSGTASSRAKEVNSGEHTSAQKASAQPPRAAPAPPPPPLPTMDGAKKKQGNKGRGRRGHGPNTSGVEEGGVSMSGLENELSVFSDRASRTLSPTHVPPTRVDPPFF